ncbi:MAG: phosphopantetheine-binding protein [Bacteroidota bacterium]
MAISTNAWTSYFSSTFWQGPFVGNASWRALPLEGRVKSIIIKLTGIGQEYYSEQGSFKHDFGMDSLDFVELVMTCERIFSIIISDEEAGNLHTAEELVQLLRGKGA